MIEQRYVSAMDAKSLHDDPNEVTRLDVIRASGMSGRNIAAHCLRLISKPTRSDIERVHAALVKVAQDRCLPGADEAAGVAIDWLIDRKCKVCAGKGVITKASKEHTCPKCKGEKMRKEPSGATVQAMLDYVAHCRGAHVGRMFHKLQ